MLRLWERAPCLPWGQLRAALHKCLGALRVCRGGRGMRGCCRGSNELFINTAKEEAYHAQEKCLLKICPNGLYGTRRIARGAEPKVVTTMAVRGAFQSQMLKARARELSKLIAIQSKLGATRLQDLPDGSRQAQREQLGWVCVRRGGQQISNDQRSASAG